MIVSCPECNGKVSSTVPRCPHCGFTMPPADPNDVDAMEAPLNRVPCPYCAEPILPAATICPRCRGPVTQGRAVHPAHRPEGPPVVVKSFTAYAVICLLLYLLCWPLSLVLNLMWYSEANTIQQQTGQEPEGKGCLFAMLIVGAVVIVLICVSILSNVERF